MSDDLVKRLRDFGEDRQAELEAAALIERLKRELEEANQSADNFCEQSLRDLGKAADLEQQLTEARAEIERKDAALQNLQKFIEELSAQISRAGYETEELGKPANKAWEPLYDWMFNGKLASYRDEVSAALTAPAQAQQPTTFQGRVAPWIQECFGPEISSDRVERKHRFLEEALELVQACGAHQNEAHELVNYVYGREKGAAEQEVGGVMVTLAALCLANGFDMDQCGEAELKRIWTKIETIRAKQAAKPKNSPLPQPDAEREAERLRSAADTLEAYFVPEDLIDAKNDLVTWLYQEAAHQQENEHEG